MHSKKSYIDGYNLFVEELEGLKTFLPSRIIKPHALFEYLAVNNRFTAFPNVFVALKIFLTMPATSHQLKEVFQNKNCLKHTYV